MTVCERLLSFCRACARTKTGNSASRRDLAHARVYTIFGAVNVAIFDFLPTAVFLLTPHVTSYVTGPSAILSVVIAGVAAILSGFSFLDLRRRLWKSTTSTQDAIHRTGSEVSSFAVAWSSVARSVALTSALVRGCSQSLNYLMGQRLTLLSLSLFGWVSSPQTLVVDVLGFMVCMVVWPLVTLRLVLRPSRAVLVLFSLSVIVVFGVLAGAAVTVSDGGNWTVVERFFPEGYEGVVTGASIFYLSLTVFEDLSRRIEYSSPKSSSLHLRSSLLGVALLGLLMAGSTSMISSMSSSSNLTTEQPLSEAFDASGSHSWTKYLICFATMVFLAPGIFVQFERSVEILEDLARDRLVGRVLISEDDSSKERSVLVCLALGCLCALGCAALSVVTLCRLAALGVLVEHMVVVVTILAIRFRGVEPGEGAEGGCVGVARSGDGVIRGYAWSREIEQQPEGFGKGKEKENGEEVDEYPGYRLIRENLREESGETGEEEEKGAEKDDGGTEVTNRVHQISYSTHPLSEVKTPSGAVEHSSGTTEESSVLNEGVLSSTNVVDIQTMDAGHSSSKSDVTNIVESEEDSSNDTDIDAIVEEYLSTRRACQVNPGQIAPSNPPQPTRATYRKACLSILLYVTSCLALAAILAHAQSHVRTGHAVWIVAMVISTAGIVTGLVWLRRQPEERVESEDEELRLEVRNLSLIYAMAILFLCAMLVTQQEVTSAVFGVWSALGLAIYVIHGVRRDRQNPPPGGQLPDEETSLLPSTSSSVYREDKPPDRKSFIFGDDLFNGSSPVP